MCRMILKNNENSQLFYMVPEVTHIDFSHRPEEGLARFFFKQVLRKYFVYLLRNSELSRLHAQDVVQIIPYRHRDFPHHYVTILVHGSGDINFDCQASVSK